MKPLFSFFFVSFCVGFVFFFFLSGVSRFLHQRPHEDRVQTTDLGFNWELKLELE